jgi:hypothetical protein
MALHAITDTQAQLDMTLSGAESLPDAYAAIDAVITHHVAEWTLDQELTEKQEHGKWMEGVTAISVVIGFCSLSLYAPQIANYLLDLLFPSSSNETPPSPLPEKSADPSPTEMAMHSKPSSYSPYEDPEQHNCF